jgi:hypothetical protein
MKVNHILISIPESLGQQGGRAAESIIRKATGNVPVIMMGGEGRVRD